MYTANVDGYEGPLSVGFPFELTNASFGILARTTWQQLGTTFNQDLIAATCVASQLGHRLSIGRQTCDKTLLGLINIPCKTARISKSSMEM